MTFGLIGDGHRDANVAIRSVRRERFLAIQNPVIAI
jgi:hypothetical protein